MVWAGTRMILGAESVSEYALPWRSAVALPMEKLGSWQDGAVLARVAVFVRTSAQEWN